MSSLTLTLLNTSADLFRKLLADYEEFNNDPLAPFKALNFATTAWHLTDWVWEEYEQVSHSNIGAMRAAFTATCPQLNIMHDLATGHKHFTVSRPKSNMSGNHYEGSFDRSFDSSFDVARLMIDFSNGVSIMIDEIFDIVVDFWTRYFKQRGIS